MVENEGQESALTAEPTVIVPAPIAPGTLSAAERRKLRSLEDRVASGIRSFRDVGGALLEIRDARLYRETHSSFEAYCDEKWSLERARAYQFMSAAGVIQALPEEAGRMVTNEAQARALAPVMRDRGVAGVQQILDSVRERGVPMTAPLIRRIAEANAHPNQPASEPNMSDRLIRDMGRLATTYRQWQASGPSRKDKQTVKAAIEQLTTALG